MGPFLPHSPIFPWFTPSTLGVDLGFFIARHSKEEQGSQEDVGCLLNFFPQVILDIFKWFLFFCCKAAFQRRARQWSWRRLPHSLALLGLTFPFAQGQPALPYHHHLGFFPSQRLSRKVIIFAFFPHHDYQGQSLLHCRHHHQYWLYRHLTDSPSLSSISTKRHGLISHSFEDSLRAIEVVFVLGMFTHLSPLSIVLL